MKRFLEKGLTLCVLFLVSGVAFAQSGMGQTPDMFRTQEEYAQYVQQTIKPGSRVVALVDYNKVKKGMQGTYYGPAVSGSPPCPILWDVDLGATPREAALPQAMPRGNALGRVYFVDWHMIQVIGDRAQELVRGVTFVPVRGPQDLQIGDRVRATGDYQKVRAGLMGTYYGPAVSGTPPCPILWDEDLGATPREAALPAAMPRVALGRVYFVDWTLLEVQRGGQQAAPPPPPVAITFLPVRGPQDLQIGDRVRATSDYQKVRAGLMGTYYGPAVSGNPPCPIMWDEDLGATPREAALPRTMAPGNRSRIYFVDWTLLEVQRGGQQAAPPAQISFVPVRGPQDLQIGDRVRATKEYAKVRAGLMGTYYGPAVSGNPPCPIMWDEDLGATPREAALPPTMPAGNRGRIYFVDWTLLEVQRGGQQAAPPPPPVAMTFVPVRGPQDLQIGDRVRATRDYQNVRAGLMGTYYGPAVSGNPPCPIMWDEELGATPREAALPSTMPPGNRGRIYFVDWTLLEVQRGGQQAAPPPVAMTFVPVRGPQDLQIGDRVRATRDYQNVRAGLMGTYYGPAVSGNPPCPIVWDEELGATPREAALPRTMPPGNRGRIYFVDWTLLEVQRGQKVTPPVSYFAPVGGPQDLRIGDRVRATKDYGKVRAGLMGTYYGPAVSGNPPCPIMWDEDLGATPREAALPRTMAPGNRSRIYFVDWTLLEVERR